MPAPMTITSACSKGMVASFASSGFRAFFTASMMPLEVKVAPETMSTSADCASTIAAGIFSIAGSEMPAVSECSKTFTSVILPPLTVTETLIWPFRPAPVPS